MKQLALSQYNNIYLIAIALFLFLSVFIGAVFMIYRKGSKKHYDYLSQLPLREENLT
ncbi:cbb3-type cytochrome oxidase subunit 3 [Candidatus Scalindua japonica]|uniref:Cbb3-type cytochrome oxidase subunit 3 n=1 Tax=Candidatus Scalindua japonica TaxID=1284222 RepID=A0A286U119_9BACT|nr:cbb3-type cytochrome c oxidase subunit 3 [Candidatus Scalindua japonica]GAX61834.1 cbb3-type cytochrome oxidase subunit 3 [Candidatus Scalindua japonica]